MCIFSAGLLYQVGLPEFGSGSNFPDKDLFRSINPKKRYGSNPKKTLPNLGTDPPEKKQIRVRAYTHYLVDELTYRIVTDTIDLISIRRMRKSNNMHGEHIYNIVNKNNGLTSQNISHFYI